MHEARCIWRSPSLSPYVVKRYISVCCLYDDERKDERERETRRGSRIGNEKESERERDRENE